MSEFHGRAINILPGFAEEPVEPKREDYADVSDAEFQKVVDMWRENHAEWEKSQAEAKAMADAPDGTTGLPE